jgi:hypothetical protein
MMNWCQTLRRYVEGTRNRRVGSHELNKDSSRSHSIMTVHVESQAAGALLTLIRISAKSQPFLCHKITQCIPPNWLRSAQK